MGDGPDPRRSAAPSTSRDGPTAHQVRSQSLATAIAEEVSSTHTYSETCQLTTPKRDTFYGTSKSSRETVLPGNSGRPNRYPLIGASSVRSIKGRLDEIASR